MDLSAAKVNAANNKPKLVAGKLSPEEKARREEHCLCGYCGDWESRPAGTNPHFSKRCQLLLNKLKKQMGDLEIKKADVGEAGKA